MHRSGTSCITRIFNLLGVTLGEELLDPASDNPKGFWENWYLVQINKQILKNSNGSRDKPPKKINLTLKNKLDILSFINNRPKNRVFGLKDPRMLLTWEAWKPYLKKYNIVAIFRHPSSVAKSLNARNGISEDLGNNLWKYYNEKLLDICNNEEITFINFDNYESFENKIQKVTSILGLNYNKDALNFYNPSNRNSDEINKISSNENLKIYNRLLDLE